MLGGIAFSVYEWLKCAFARHSFLIVEGSIDKMKNIYPLNSRFTLPFAFVLAVSLLAVSLMFMLPGGSLHAQTPAIEYAENGTGAVATYTAMDPEQTAIVSWTLDGTDAGVFDIEGGVLTFKESPDFEMPVDVAGTSPSTAAVNDNMYEVTVQATDSTNKVGMEPIMVEVTNVDEPGTVTLSALRPQSAVEFTASPTDPDGTMTDTTWQWAKASSRNGAYNNIEDAIASSYMPKDADVGSYLRATASYTDPEGSGKSAMARSEYVVQAVRGTNNPPVFPDQDPDTDEDQSDTATREVAENTPAGMAIGDPVAAEDMDGDVLTYTLTGNNVDNFDINWATGQIMTKGPLNFETGMSHTVTVRATDPAGVPSSDTENSDTITVTITVTDVNEAPDVTGAAAVTFQEVAGVIATPLARYTAPDADADDISVTWSVSGADGGKFTITGGALEFKAKPDFENAGDANSDNVYEVTVVAADSNGNRGTMDVKVTVANENEDGTVTLSRTQPRVGVSVRATLSDPDGSISGLRWQWYRSEAINSGNIESTTNLTTTECENETSVNCVIKDATSDIYTPTTDDVDNTLTAVATYTDGQAAMQRTAGEAAVAVARDTRNRPPAFIDQDTEVDGIQNQSATRMVEENTEADATDDATDAPGDNVGPAVMATDPDPNEDPLIYTLSGADAGLFSVRDNGQIEVGAGTELDYETQATYMVTLTAEDSFGASASIAVTIMVTDMDEVPDVTGDDTIEYEENGTGAVATYTAMDPEQTAIVSWSLDGTDAALFDIENGELTFKKSPDYEADGTDNMHSVTVQATDSTMKTGPKEVMVEVINVDEPGTVTLSALRPQSATMFTATLTDPDGAITGTTWQWSKATSRNGSYRDIEDAIASSYEPGDPDIGSYLRATASYTDPEGSGKSAMARSDNKAQGVRGLNEAPVFPDQDPDTDEDQSDTAMREVAENTPAGMAIGDPVAATDANGDILTYTLTGNNVDNFDINWATGQIMTKEALDEETGSSYTVTVRATDPEGVPQIEIADMDNSDTIAVTIMVTDVNEAPAVTGEAEVSFAENAESLAIGDYTENDPETNIASTWSVSGADAGKFTIDGGALMFMAKPDFEMPGDANRDNTYEVTVVAADSDGNRGTMDVKVMVANENEDGTVTLSRAQLRVGVSVRATLTDPDGSISSLGWQWYRSTTINSGDIETTTSLPMAECEDDTSDNCVIEGAMSDTYTPTRGDARADDNIPDNGFTLTAVATYTDGQDEMQRTAGEAANMVAVDTRNRPPAFDDQDTEVDGIQNTMAERSVEENTEANATDDAADDGAADNVGSAVMATDPDPNADALIYTLSGADAGLFRVRDNGQIEVGAGTKLDYETQATYEVTLTAEDSFGDTASIDVTIMVTDMDEPPEIMAGGLSISGRSNMDYAENGTGPVATYVVSGPDAALASWSLEGDDAGDFMIEGSGMSVMLRFRSSPDHEAQGTYMVTLKADDGTYMDERNVTIMVTDEDEAPTIVGEDTINYPENGTGAVETYTAMDPEEATITWSLAGADASAFDITDGVLTFKAPPDHEMAADADTDNMYSVTIQATDETMNIGTKEVTVTVTNVSDDPLEISGLSPVEYAENGTGAVATYMVAGPNADSATWTLEGPDAGDFMIEGSGISVMLRFRSSPDHEVQGTYMVTLKADDGTYMDEHNVTIMVTDEDEAPTIVGEDTINYPENGTGAVETYTAMDPEGAMITWSLAGADAAAFDITDGALTFKAPPDYEMLADTDNEYEVTILATDATMKTGTKTVMVMVTDVDEVPTIAGDATTDYAENGTGEVATFAAVDPEEAMITWSLAGADAGVFDISGAGMLTFKESPDYEMPADADNNNTYMVTVEASDGTNMASHEVAVTVTDVSEMAPEMSLLEMYDENDNNRIDKNEVLAGVEDYIFRQTITREQVLELVELYIFG